MSEKNGHPVAYFDDGYTQELTVDATQWHPAVSVTYRPMVRSEYARHNAAMAKCDSDLEKMERQAAAALAGQLKSWDLTDRDGKEVSISADTVSRIEPHLFGTLYEAVVHAPHKVEPPATESPAELAAKN